jgi:ornithine cyclodeaminase
LVTRLHQSQDKTGMKLISAAKLRAALNWESAISALSQGHLGAHPLVQDLLLNNGAFSLFGRGVILPGQGAGMKIAAIHPPNLSQTEPVPAEHAAFAVIGENSKQICAIVDGTELTRWKTAADSALGSRLLSRVDSETLLVIGAGPIAAALAEAHLHVRPAIRTVLLWNRSPTRLEPMQQALEATGKTVQIVDDLTGAIAQADIISSATGTKESLITGAHVRPGCHVDLVGGFEPEMRESDDTLVANATVFVNYRATAIDAGDICQPIRTGLLSAADIKGDLYDLVRSAPLRSPEEITLYKNAGGAHIDLMVARSFFGQT